MTEIQGSKYLEQRHQKTEILSLIHHICLLALENQLYPEIPEGDREGIGSLKGSKSTTEPAIRTVLNQENERLSINWEVNHEAPRKAIRSQHTLSEGTLI